MHDNDSTISRSPVPNVLSQLLMGFRSGLERKVAEKQRESIHLRALSIEELAESGEGSKLNMVARLCTKGMFGEDDGVCWVLRNFNIKYGGEGAAGRQSVMLVAETSKGREIIGCVGMELMQLTDQVQRGGAEREQEWSEIVRDVSANLVRVCKLSVDIHMLYCSICTIRRLCICTGQIFGARGKHRGFSPGAAARHSQIAREHTVFLSQTPFFFHFSSAYTSACIYTGCTCNLYIFKYIHDHVTCSPTKQTKKASKRNCVSVSVYVHVCVRERGREELRESGEVREEKGESWHKGGLFLNLGR